MIKWMLTTLLLMVTVAVVTVVYLVPALRDKSQKLIQSQTEMVKSRVADVKEILADKQHLKNILDKPQPTPVKTVAAEKKTTPVKPSPKLAEGSTAEVIPDQIPASDRRKLEELLEKANR